MKLSMTRIAALLMAIIMCMGMFVSCDKDKTLDIDTVKKDPYAAIIDGYMKDLETLWGKYSDVFAVCDKVSSGVGTYTIKSEGADSADVSNILAAGIDISAVVDASKGTYSGNLSVGVGMGVSMDVSLFGDSNNVALSAPLLLGEGNYGVKFDTFEEDLAKSELWKLLFDGMSYEDFKAEMTEDMEMSFGELIDAFSGEKMKAAFDKYMKDTAEIMKGITPEVTEGKFDKTDVVSVKYTLTKDDMKKLAEVEITAYKELLSVFMATDDFSSIIDEMKDEQIIVTYHLNKSSGSISAMELVAYDGVMTVTFGPDIAKKFEMNVDLSMTIEGEKTDMKVDIAEVTDEGKGGFIMNIDMNGAMPTIEKDGEAETSAVSATMSMIRNDADGKYELKMEGDGETTAVVTGQLTYSADELKLTVDSVTSDDETVDMNLEFSVKAGGEVKALPEYKNILTMSAEEAEMIVYMIQQLTGWGQEDEYDEEYVSDEYLEALEMYEEYMADGELSEDELDDLYELYYEDMTEEEIEQFEQELIEMGMTREEFISMMFVG